MTLEQSTALVICTQSAPSAQSLSEFPTGGCRVKNTSSCQTRLRWDHLMCGDCVRASRQRLTKTITRRGFHHGEGGTGRAELVSKITRQRQAAESYSLMMRGKKRPTRLPIQCIVQRLPADLKSDSFCKRADRLKSFQLGATIVNVW